MRTIVSSPAGLEQFGPGIGRDSDQDEEETDDDVERGLVQRLLALERRGPPHHARAEERRADAARPHGPAVADEEAGDQHERADEVEADRDRPVERGAAAEASERREARRPDR